MTLTIGPRIKKEGVLSTRRIGSAEGTHTFTRRDILQSGVIKLVCVSCWSWTANQWPVPRHKKLKEVRCGDDS
jgi:hypothetical protein